jgi:DNA-directed RNA polymerase beta' subunit
MSKIKLKDILSEAFDDVQQDIDRHQVSENVKNFGHIGKSLYNNSIVEIAEQLSDIAESAHSDVLSETDDWFDKVSVNKNMKSLKGSVVEFQKTAKEAHMLNQRLTGLYEDIGHVLNRYYEIDEALDVVGKEDDDIDNDGDNDESDEYLRKRRAAVSKAVKNEDKGDMDNDGKYEPDDEEYLQNKDKAIKAAMKSTKEGLDKRPVKRLKDVSNVVAGIPMLGDMIKSK